MENEAKKIDFERSKLLLDVIHLAVGVEEARLHASAAAMELKAMVTPKEQPKPAPGQTAMPSGAPTPPPPPPPGGINPPHSPPFPPSGAPR